MIFRPEFGNGTAFRPMSGGSRDREERTDLASRMGAAITRRGVAVAAGKALRIAILAKGRRRVCTPVRRCTYQRRLCLSRAQWPRSEKRTYLLHPPVSRKRTLLSGLLCPERSTRSNMHHFHRLEAKTSSQVWPCLLCASQGGHSRAAPVSPLPAPFRTSPLRQTMPHTQEV